jgi:hypothetical protein
MERLCPFLPATPVRTLLIAFILLLTNHKVVAQINNKTTYTTSAQAIDTLFRTVEKHLLQTAEVMPADKYGYAPTNGEFKGVRTFGQQLKHLSADNYILGAAALNVPPPVDAGDEMGPDTVRTKAEIINYLKNSFTYLHKALESIDEKNLPTQASPISPFLDGKATALGLVVESLLHANDHYGQLVVYLRMNGIVPVASRP